MKVYIVKGVVESRDNAPYSVVSEFGVRSNLESARKELLEVANEIECYAEDNELEITTSEIEEDKIYIEIEGEEIHKFEIVEREVLE